MRFSVGTLLLFAMSAMSFAQTGQDSKAPTADAPTANKVATPKVPATTNPAAAKTDTAANAPVTKDDASSTLEIPLHFHKAFGLESTNAIGRFRAGMRTGQVTAMIEDLTEPCDLWVVENRDGALQNHTVAPEPDDNITFLGTFEPGAQGIAALSAQIAPNSKIDVVVVTPEGVDPEIGGLLHGFPTLDDRMRRGWTKASFERLVAEGERLFKNETFSGNGRTCATCHPEENNFTIDPAFIRTRPKNDPLFVAETNPQLAKNFENPKLMRDFGLILENTNGFDRTFTMRSTNHIFGLRRSMKPSTVDGSTNPPTARLGNSGDGSAGGGSLREFAIGAVTQHFPKSTKRIAGKDFRLPTDHELDALEAFQLSVGQQQELDIGSMSFINPAIAKGRNLFNGKAKCSRCHNNCGANLADGTNGNFNTGVETLRKPGNMPADDGFGHPGDGKFNTMSIIEAADTPPFFHNHSVKTIEDAVKFYTSSNFAGSPSGQFIGPINLNTEEIRLVAAFLRVVNSLDNIRSAKAYLTKGGRTKSALAEVEDAIQVLQPSEQSKALEIPAAKRLRAAQDFIKQGNIAKAQIELTGARSLIVR